MLPVEKNPTPSELRKFGATILIGLGIIGALLWWLAVPAEPDAPLSLGRIIALCVWCLGAITGALGFLAPGAARFVYIAWMTFAMALGAVMTPVLFTVVFVVVLPVFSLIRFRDPLRKKLEPSENPSGSYWEEYTPHEATLDRSSRLF